jgi:hypothetical protein
MTAWAHYGAYVEDTDSRFPEIDIFTQASSSWTDFGERAQWASVAGRFGFAHTDDLSSFVPIRVGKLQVVNPCVPERTCPGAVSRATSSGSGSIPVYPAPPKRTHARRH